MILPGEMLQARGITEKETGSSLLSQELSKKAKAFPWLEDSDVERLPGPLAYEYAGFNGTIIEGNVEGACWKFTNLVQVILAYLVAVCLEDQEYWDKVFQNKTNINSPSNKIEYYIKMKHFHNNAYKNELIGVIRQILQWRNYYGVGHGTLTQSKGDLLVRLLELSQDFLLCFSGFNNFLEENKLHLAGSKGPITGRDYFLNVDGIESYNRAFCNNITSLPDTICPVVFCGYQFDGPDIYFLDCVYDPERTPKRLYRNFSRNRLKYFLNRHSFNIAWYREPKQVAWLNKNERDDWCRYFENNNDSTVWENIVYAAATFQERGMYEEAEWCIKVYDDKRRGRRIPKPRKMFELELGIKLTRYSILAARGNYFEAEKILGELDGLTQDAAAAGSFAGTKVALKRSWYEGIYKRDPEKAIKICNDAVATLTGQKKNLPYTALTYELELNKNILYLSSAKKAPNRDVLQEMKNLCWDVLRDAYALYVDDPDNLRLVDIMGFACNLYSFYTLEMMKSGNSSESATAGDEKKIIWELNQFGEAVRERAYNMDRTDIWTMRGYAWSLHQRARLHLDEFLNNEADGQSNKEERGKIAIELLEEARDIRQKYRENESYRTDLGVVDDLLRNYIELFLAKDSPPALVSEFSKKVSGLINELSIKEGESPRVISFKEKAERAGLSINK